jgi:hypothetical protein
VDVWLSGHERFVEPSTPRTFSRPVDRATTSEDIAEFSRAAVGTWHLHEESGQLIQDVLLRIARSAGRGGCSLELRLSQQPGPRRACVTIVRG